MNGHFFGLEVPRAEGWCKFLRNLTVLDGISLSRDPTITGV
jgi:hypothetical protein